MFRRKKKMKKTRRAKNRLLKRAKKKAAKKWRKRNPTLNCWRIPLEYSLHRCIVILQNLPRNKSCLNTSKFNLFSLFVWIRPKARGNFVLLHRYWWNTRIFPFTKKSYLHRAQWRYYFLSFTYEDIGVAMVTNMISQLLSLFLLYNYISEFHNIFVTGILW